MFLDIGLFRYMQISINMHIFRSKMFVYPPIWDMRRTVGV